MRVSRRVRAVGTRGRSRMAAMTLNRLIRTLVNVIVANAITSPSALAFTMLVGVTANVIAIPEPSADQPRKICAETSATAQPTPSPSSTPGTVAANA
jgi:hypothetical protein